MTGSRVLIAGIGNIFASDDGFGVEVAARLSARRLPAGVRAADFGIRGVHLAYDLLDGWSALILVDAVPMGDSPGTLAVIDPADDTPPVPVAGTGGDDQPVLDAHSMSPEVVLGTLQHLGGGVGWIRVVGCQPASLAEGMGLSPAVAGAVDTAVELCLQLVAEIPQSTERGVLR